MLFNDWFEVGSSYISFKGKTAGSRVAWGGVYKKST